MDLNDIDLWRTFETKQPIKAERIAEIRPIMGNASCAFLVNGRAVSVKSTTFSEEGCAVGDYLVVYPNGDLGWLPAKVFETILISDQKEPSPENAAA